MSEVDNQFVQQGLWTDWRQGGILGRTITTDARTGAIVISVLAILAALTMTHLWNLITFAIHQLRAHNRPADALYWQQQALLRTLPSPSSVIVDNFKLWWAWRNKTNALRRCSVPILLAVLFIVSSLATTIFTSLIVSSSGLDVLVWSSSCGRINPILMQRLEGSDADVNTYPSEINELASDYVKNCYQPGATSSMACHSIFTNGHIPFTQNTTICPFNESICLGGDMSAVSLDTGLLDLNAYLGANLRSSERVLFRKRTECAVLKRDDHYQIANITDSADLYILSGIAPSRADNSSGVPTLLLSYGVPTGRNISKEFGNVTFTQPLPGVHVVSSQSYSLFGPEDLQSVTLLPEMARKDADVSIIVIYTSGYNFKQPVNDLVFAAHSTTTAPGRVSVAPDQNITWYQPDYLFGAIGCAEQYQYCISRANEPYCTELSGIPQPSSVSEEMFPGATQVQLAALKLLISVGWMFDMHNAITQNNGRLNATAALSPSYTLPDNQWIIETVQFKSFVLATWQALFADYAVGPRARSQSTDAYVDLATTDGEKELCRSQKMRKAGGFANINFFGLMFIIVTFGVVIVLDLFLLRFLLLLSEFQPLMAHRLDCWVHDGVFQWQRRAFEGLGRGVWQYLDKEIPTTVSLEDLPRVKAERHSKHGDEFKTNERNVPEVVTEVRSSCDADSLQRTVAFQAVAVDHHEGSMKL